MERLPSISFGSNSGSQVAINNGRINNTIYHHTVLDRPETPPSPLAVIPFSRDKDFIQRGRILDQILNLYMDGGSRVALTGLGGIGKSQIAIEYAYQVRERRPDSWVFWVHASNAVRYEQSIRNIAENIKLPGRHDPKINIYRLLGDWLRSEKSGKWAIILDNVDDASFLVEAQTTHGDRQQSNAGDPNSPSPPFPLVYYLPHCPNGSVLITARSRHVALQMVEQQDMIVVEAMSPEDALALMDKKLGKLVAGQDTACAALVAALEYMPLAIVQATSYLLQRAQRCSVSQYLEKFRRNDRKRAGLLDFEGGQLRRDPGAKNSIILTWQISFDYIRNMRPSAADLLSLMCFCDRQGIPESLLRGLGNDNEDDSDNEDDNRSNEYDGSASEFQQQSHIKDKQSDDETCADCETSTSDCHSTSSSSSGDAFEADISILRSYSFITINTYGTAFEMHSLVQLAMRKWLQEQGQQERWKQDLIHCVCAEAPNGQYENWITWQKLLPHAQSAILYRPKNNEKSLKQWGTVLYRMAWYLLEIGRVVEALEVAEEVMKARIKLFGPTHEDSLWAMAIVSDIQCHLGTWEEAEKLSVQVIEARKIKLGADHPHTLISMGSLASTYRGQGRWEEAEKLEVQVMEAHKIKLGADHPDTLTSMGNLAYTWQHMGDFVEAMALLRECIRYREVRLGLNHPSTQSSIATLSAWEGKREANDR